MFTLWLILLASVALGGIFRGFWWLYTRPKKMNDDAGMVPYGTMGLLPTLVGMVGRAGHGKDSVGIVLEERHGFFRDAMAKPLKDSARIFWQFSEDQLYGNLKEVVDKRWGVSPREALQFLGTEVGREMFSKIMPKIGQRFWLEHFKLRYQKFLQLHPAGRVVVCDVRFPDEAQLVRELGGIIVKVIRPNHNAFTQPPHPDPAAVDHKTDDTKAVPNTGDQKTTDAEKASPHTEAHKMDEKTVADQNEVVNREKRKSGHKSESMIDEIVPDVVIVNDGSLADLANKVDQDIIPLIRQLHKRHHKPSPKID